MCGRARRFLLALLQQGEAPLQACLCIMLASAPGIPLSWRKLQLSSELRWIGWSLRFAAAAFGQALLVHRQRALATVMVERVVPSAVETPIVRRRICLRSLSAACQMVCAAGSC